MRCLLIAPLDVDTSGVRDALKELALKYVLSTRVGAGATLASTDLTAFDFAIAVLRYKRGGNRLTPGITSVLVETGIALGAGLPVLIIGDQKSDIPAALSRLPVVATDLSDSQTLSLHLRLFSKGLAAVEAHTQRQGHDYAALSATQVLEFRSQLESARLAESGRGLLRLALNVLRSAGVQGERALQRFEVSDGAFYVPGHEQDLGYVLVELKAGGRVTAKGLNAAQRKLQDAVLSRNGGLGLLIFDDPHQPPPTLQVTPLVIALSFDQLLDELARRPLAEVLLEARNAAVHRL